MIRQYALSIFLLLSAVGNISAFTPAMSTRSLASVSPIVPPLFMSEEPEASAEEPAPEETVEEEVPEDPELTALKQEIANLESELKAKQSTLSYTQSQVDEYSKGGYARKVAEMETMRRVRSVSSAVAVLGDGIDKSISLWRRKSAKISRLMAFASGLTCMAAKSHIHFLFLKLLESTEHEFIKQIQCHC